MGVSSRDLFKGTYTALTRPHWTSYTSRTSSDLHRYPVLCKRIRLLNFSGSGCLSLNPPAEVLVALGSSLPAAMALLMRMSCLRGQRRMPLRRQARFSVVGQMPSCIATQRLGQSVSADAGSGVAMQGTHQLSSCQAAGMGKFTMSCATGASRSFAPRCGKCPAVTAGNGIASCAFGVFSCSNRGNNTASISGLAGCCTKPTAEARNDYPAKATAGGQLCSRAG